jgi:hypothetical protein
MVQAVVSKRFPNKVIIHLQDDEMIIHTTTNMVIRLDIKRQNSQNRPSTLGKRVKFVPVLLFGPV